MRNANIVQKHVVHNIKFNIVIEMQSTKHIRCKQWKKMPNVQVTMSTSSGMHLRIVGIELYWWFVLKSATKYCYMTSVIYIIWNLTYQDNNQEQSR